MGPVIGLLLLAGASPSTPLDLETVRARFADHDLVSLARARAVLSGRGVDVSVGAWGLMDDLSRLMRCLPLSAVPARENEPFAAARALARLERIRLERRIEDGAHAGTSLDRLLEAPFLRTQVEAQSAVLVRWPVESERWADEVPDPRPTPSRCADRRGGPKDLGRDATVRARARAAAERAAVAALVPRLEALPDQTACKVAFAYLSDAERAGPRFLPPASWLGWLERGLMRGRGPTRVAGLLALAQIFERAEQPLEARRVLRSVLEEHDRTPEQDSRARVHLVGLLEPDWPQVIAVVSRPGEVRPVDRPVLDNAEARARYALEDTAGLMTFGRRFIQRAHAGRFDDQTRDLLLRLALGLPVPEALAWIDEVLPKDPRRRRDGQASLGRWASTRGATALAAALFDRLRRVAIAERAVRGPKAVADEARWVAARAEVAYEVGDVAGFGGLLEELTEIARRSESQPLARFAPHRALAELGQAVLGRLVNRAPDDPQQAQLAGHLLESVSALSADRSRWRAKLLELIHPLATLAGPYAEGRRPAAKPRGPPATPVRQLGEVVIARLPAKLEAPDHRTPLPRLDSMLIYQGPGGVWRQGAPWARDGAPP